jgi:uncharacterized protein (TIGR03086 family)
VPPDPTPAERHRTHAARFTALVAGTRDWDAPTPVAEWTARDVVRHLVEWLPGLLSSGCEVRLPAGPSAIDDPAAAWAHHRDAVQAVLDDPEQASSAFDHPRAGSHDVAGAIDQFYTPDVYMHSWDLARATGQDDDLDEALSAAMLAGMSSMEDMLRQSGQFGQRQPAPPTASATEQLMAFIGRDPDWRPPA